MYSREKIDQRNLARIYSTTSRLEYEMFESLFAGSDKFFGRVGTPAISAGLGASAGAGLAFALEKSLPVGAAIGAVAGGVGSEAGRFMFCDKKKLVELQLKDLDERGSELLAELLKLEEAEADKAKAKK
jgi:hypothetical protein